MEGDTISQKMEAETFDIVAWSDFSNFRIWRVNFRSGISSCASRPIEAMMWINEIGSVKSIPVLETSCSITGSKL